MFCVSCGKQVPDGQAFCSYCGTPQPVEQPVAQPVAQPVVQPVEQPAAQPVEQPVVQPQVQPAPVTYVQQAPEVQPSPVKQSNGAAVAGLVFGILAVFLGWIPVIGWIFCIIGLICSIVGFANIKKKNSGTGPAIAGLITSIFGTIITVLITVILAFSVLTVGISTYMERAQEAAEEVRIHNAEIDDYYT